MLVVVVAVLMWESPERFPRAGGRAGKQLYRFPMLSTGRHSHGLFFPRNAFCPFQRAQEAERLRSGLDDVGSIRNPIQQCLTEPRIRKHRCPFGELQVGCDDDGRSLGPFRDHLKEELRADVGKGNVSDLVQRDQFVLLPSCHQLADLVVLLGFNQLVDQRRRRGEANAPLLPASRQTQARGQVGFSSAALADQNDRFLALDIAAVCQFAYTEPGRLRSLPTRKPSIPQTVRSPQARRPSATRAFRISSPKT